MSEQARRQFIAGLRALAAFYERRPGAYYDGMRATLSMYAAGRRAPEACTAMAAAFAAEDGEGEDRRAAAVVRAGEAERSGRGCCCCARAVLARDFSAKVRLELFVPGVDRRRCEGVRP